MERSIPSGLTQIEFDGQKRERGGSRILIGTLRRSWLSIGGKKTVTEAKPGGKTARG